MRDMFNHKMTIPAQWQLAMMPNFFTKYEMRFGRFLNDSTVVEPSYDPMCATLSKGCYPVLALDPAKLVNETYGPAEARKLALAVNGTEGFEDWMIDEEVRGAASRRDCIHRSQSLHKSSQYHTISFHFES